MDNLFTTLQELKKSVNEQRPRDIHSKVTDIIAAYDRLTELSLTSKDKHKVLRLFASVAQLKWDFERGNHQHVQSRVLRMVDDFGAFRVSQSEE
jgi:hypothetical protein